MTVTISGGRVPARGCPICGVVHDGATSLSMDGEATAPIVGDVTICAECWSFLIFTDTGFRVASQSEIERVAPDLREILAAWIQDKRGRP